jgi:hypothetical protein
MRSVRLRWAISIGLASSVALLGLFIGCKAGVQDGDATGGGGASHTGTTSQGTGMSTGDGTTVGQFMGTTGSGDAPNDVPINPCGTACGPVELCDGVNKGIDDNCDGVVDEGCPCSAGQAESCFKGDPSYLGAAGCFPGTQQCTENGSWGPCIGGNHATESCFANQQGCHAISAVPFQTVDLTSGIGNFGGGGGSYMLDCPGGVMPCPTPDATGHVQVIVSGEYTVTYTDMNGMTCQYPLYVGAKGLRVELTWDYPVGGQDVDLDLHMHEPGTTTPWATSGANQDCGYGNCKISSFGTLPSWFPAVQAMPGDPVQWFKDPVMTNNTCYYAPMCGGGFCDNPGADWIANGQGCHNPRLDIDNIFCDPSQPTTDSYFCNPENINVDFPPKDKWTRIAVHYYGSHGYTADIHPDVKIYCDGALAGELGSHAFYTPEIPVTFTPAMNTVLWVVADVFYKKDQCSSACIVQPVYANPMTKFPQLEPNGGPSFGPPYPPNP